jgi:(2Fe-2S) ferredoxin
VSKLKQAGKVLPFYLEGRFVGFVGEFGEKPKRIRVATAEGERYIKLSKELRYPLREALQPGDWIRVFGEQKQKYKTGELKLKAFQVTVTTPVQQKDLGIGTTQVEEIPPLSPSPSVPLSAKPAAPKTKSCIMVCQKSSCRKRGGDRVCEAIAESLRERGLDDEVALKGTGCMKQCKQGPCAVFMPDKSRYTGVAPKDIDKLIEKHFAAKLKPEQSKLELSPVP